MATLQERFINRCEELFTGKRPAPFINYGEKPYSTIELLNGNSKFLAYLLRAEHPNKTVYELRTQWRGTKSDEQRYSSDGNSKPKFSELTEKVVSELEEALPYPEETYWGVLDGNYITVLFMLRQVQLGPDQRVLPPPRDQLAVTKQACSNAIWPKLVLPGGWLNMQAFWQAIGRRELVPLHRMLQGRIVMQGARSKVHNIGALIIDGDLLMHPKGWQQFPESTSQDITNLVRKF